MSSVGSSVGSFFFSGLSTDFKKKNFGLYGHWFAILGIIIALGCGIGNIFTFHAIIIVFSIISIVQALVVLFVEIPVFLKCCPLTDKFIAFVGLFDSNLNRMGFYLLNAAIQYLSLLGGASSLLVPAIWWTCIAALYGLAVLKHQDFEKTSMNKDAVSGQAQEHVVRNVL